MPEPELSLLFVRPLNRIGARYVISGSIASMIYGEPRLTNDVDFVIFLRDTNIVQLQKIFPAPEFYVPPPEVIAAEIARPAKGHFSVIHANTGFKADFYPAGRDELNVWAFRNSRKKWNIVASHLSSRRRNMSSCASWNIFTKAHRKKICATSALCSPFPANSYIARN